MSDRDDPARDDRKSPVRLPGLVVWEEEPTGVEKVLDRIRRLLGGGGDEPAPEEAESAAAPPPPAPIEPMPLPDAREPEGRKGEAGVLGARAEDVGAPPEPPEAPERPEPRQAPQAPEEPLQRSTLQMLPGRLEPVNPGIVRQELRFLRTPGAEQEVTLGSADDAPPGHVAVDHASVQPFHARMRFRDGSWTIESLADVDPVRLNREPIDPEAGARPLTDGDTVRLGRAEFVFRIS